MFFNSSNVYSKVKPAIENVQSSNVYLRSNPYLYNDVEPVVMYIQEVTHTKGRCKYTT